jgi:hypothetical protein
MPNRPFGANSGLTGSSTAAIVAAMVRLTHFAMIGLILAHAGALDATQDAWKPVTGGAMSVSLPCTGEWTTNKQDVPEEASVVTSHLLACKTADSFYLVMWSEVETKAQFDGMLFLRSSRDAMVKQAGGAGGAQLLASSDIVHDGLKGIEFTANLRGASLLSSRGVFQGHRIYQVSVGTPLDQDRSADIKRLLASLKIAR